MKVALVHDWLTGFRGGEKCLEVLCRLFPDADLYTLLRRPGSTSHAIERMKVSTSFLQRLPGIANYYRYALPLMPLAVERLQLPTDVDLVVSLSHAVAKNIQPPPGVPHVCYCFTPMRYAWHMRQQYFGAAATRLKSPLARAMERMLAVPRTQILNRLREWDKAASERVTHFVAISNTVRQRIADCYGREAEVIYPPVDVDFYTPTFTPREDYYLCVSALAPYKRIDLAIEACKRLGRRLVIIGAGPMERQLRQIAGSNVELLGWQSNDAIRQHMRKCRALLFPGCEDFGIVPLEAQACGTPVIALASGGASETVVSPTAITRGTGVLFAEQTPAALASAIVDFEEHPDQFSAALAHRQAEQFNGTRFEQQISQYLKSVVDGSSESWQSDSDLAIDRPIVLAA